MRRMTLTQVLTLSPLFLGLVLLVLYFLAYGDRLPRPPLALAALLVIGATVWMHRHILRSVKIRLYDGLERISLAGAADIPGPHIEDDIERLILSSDEIAAEVGALLREREDLAKGMSALKGRLGYYADGLGHIEEFLERMDCAIFLYRSDGSLHSANDKACRLCCLSRKELLERSFFDLQEDAELTMSKNAEKIGERTSSVRYETRLKRKQKDPIHVEIDSYLVDIEKDLFLSMVRDVTVRKGMEQTLARTEDTFRSFMENASDAMFISGEDGNISYANSAMLHLLGYPWNRLRGMNISELSGNGTNPGYTAFLERMLGDDDHIHELTWTHANGDAIIGEMKAQGVYDHDGKFEGIRGVFRDITQRKKIEESQRLSQLGKLTADVTHEMKNALAVIFHLACMCREEETDPEEIKQNIDLVIEQCSDTNDFIRKLLNFSRPTADTVESADVNEIVSFAVRLLKKPFMKDDIDIETSLSDALPKLRLDRNQIKEVLINLMQNAAEAIGQSGRIHITTHTEDGKVQILIEDSGEGIPEDQLKNIFDPFFTTKEHGTGLGLSVCYGIVNAHNGELRFESRVGVGTKAILLFPVNDAGPPGPEAGG